MSKEKRKSIDEHEDCPKRYKKNISFLNDNDRDTDILCSKQLRKVAQVIMLGHSDQVFFKATYNRQHIRRGETRSYEIFLTFKEYDYAILQEFHI